MHAASKTVEFLFFFEKCIAGSPRSRFATPTTPGFVSVRARSRLFSNTFLFTASSGSATVSLETLLPNPFNLEPTRLETGREDNVLSFGYNLSLLTEKISFLNSLKPLTSTPSLNTPVIYFRKKLQLSVFNLCFRAFTMLRLYAETPKY